MFNALLAGPRLTRSSATLRLHTPLQIRCLSLTPCLQRFGDYKVNSTTRPRRGQGWSASRPPGQYGNGPPSQYGGGRDGGRPPSRQGGGPPNRYGDGPPSRYGGGRDGGGPPDRQGGGPPSRYGDGPPSRYGVGRGGGGPPSRYGDGPPSRYGGGRDGGGPPDRQGPPSRYGDGPPSRYGDGPPSRYGDGPPSRYGAGRGGGGPPSRYGGGRGGPPDGQTRRPSVGYNKETTFPRNHAPHGSGRGDLTDHEAIAIDKEHEVDVETPDEVSRFQELADKNMIDARIIRTITDTMKYDEMTKVQRKTIASTLEGNDVLAQARTGTGKTIAFLLPALQRLITSPVALKPRATDIRCIVISPTRELAMQIHNDAVKMTRGTPIACQVAVGGVGKSNALMKMRREGCHILIATPGRLMDLITDQNSGVNVENVDTLVLDEGDTLLDQGFAVHIKEIVGKLPPPNSSVRDGAGRQSLVFSATMPERVLQMVRGTLKSDYQFLKMVSANETPVHERVTQHLIPVKGFENFLPSVVELAQRESLENEHFKAIIFLPTTKFAALAAATFRGALPSTTGTTTVEIHSRLTQNARTRAANDFRRAKKAVMFASDVVARGMDFPNVTHVIQLSIPSSKEQYIHRLGRTARGDKTGVGYLMVTEDEASERVFQSLIRGLGLLSDSHGLQTPSVDMEREQTLPTSAADALTKCTEASLAVDPELKNGTYVSCLGYFSGIYPKQTLITALNKWATVGWGMASPPSVDPKLMQKLGFSKVEGLNFRGRSPGAFGSSGRFGDSAGGYGGSGDHAGGARMGGGYKSGAGSRGSFGTPRRDNRNFNFE